MTKKKSLKKSAKKMAGKITKKSTAKKITSTKNAGKITKKSTAKKITSTKNAGKITKKSIAKKITSTKNAGKTTEKTTTQKTNKKTAIAKTSDKTTKKNTTQKITKKQDLKPTTKIQVGFKSKKLKARLNQREKELQKILEKEKEETMILKDMQGRTYCQIENCDYSAVIDGYCRIHFFGLYKTIKKKKEILEQDILTKRFSYLAQKYSEEIFEPLFKDLSSDKSFKTVLKKISSEDTEDIDL